MVHLPRGTDAFGHNAMRFRALATLLLFVLPAAMVAIVAHASLYAARVDHFLDVLSELRNGGVESLSPELAARDAAWMTYYGYFPDIGGPVPFPPFPRMTLFGTQDAEWVAFRAAVVIGSYAVGGCAAFALVWARSRSVRVVPLELSAAERWRMVWGAMRMAWPWSVMFSALAVVLVWYVALPRAAAPFPLQEGTFPSPRCLAALTAGWAIASALVAVAFLPAAWSRCLDSTSLRLRCNRCGYPRHGLGASPCPECGGVAAPGSPDQHTRWRAHRTIARASAAVVGTLLGLALLVGATISASRDWLAMRPPPATPTETWMMSAPTPQKWKCAYGSLEVRATRSDDVAKRSSRWSIRWAFVPLSSCSLPPETGSAEIEVDHAGPASATLSRTLPCGRVDFVASPGNPGLFLHLPPLVFSYADVPSPAGLRPSGSQMP